MSRANNPWVDKAKALDRYRWRLLRNRYGLLGSALRFLRDALHDGMMGLCAHALLDNTSSTEPHEFLLLQSAPKVILLQRKKLLLEALRIRGYRLAELALPDSLRLLSARMLRRPPHSVPLRYFAFAAHAEWLVHRYQPRILLNDRNGSLYAPFLRLSLNARGGLLVHLAHAMTLENSRRLGMNDYDYYFLFGRSSLNALHARKLRFGNSTAVLVGSHMIDHSYQLPPADPRTRILLLLGVGPDKEKQAGYQHTYALLLEWASRHPEYKLLVKAHPRSEVLFWKKAERTISNIQVLPSQHTLADALASASVVVNIMSNAVIEAALSNRPVVYVNCSNHQDIFSQNQFFGEQISTLQAMDLAVKAIENDYLTSLQRSAAFVAYHLASGTRGLDQNIHSLERLLANLPPAAPCEPLPASN